MKMKTVALALVGLMALGGCAFVQKDDHSSKDEHAAGGTNTWGSITVTADRTFRDCFGGLTRYNVAGHIVGDGIDVRGAQLTISFGDGDDPYTAGNEVQVSHDYEGPGPFRIRITGTLRDGTPLTEGSLTINPLATCE